jgi:Holliday junction resolvase RusA-like endonuclease
MQIFFPIEFLVNGTPVSLSSQNAKAKERWKDRIKNASSSALPKPHFASIERHSITIYYFPTEPMQGDVDNIVKLILDGMSGHVYVVIDRWNVSSFKSSSREIPSASQNRRP